MHGGWNAVSSRKLNDTYQEITMKTFTATLLGACMALAVGAVAAQDSMKKGDSMSKDGMAKKDMAMSMQECKDHMAMAKKDGMKKDAAMMKKDTMCADMMNKDKMTKKGG